MMMNHHPRRILPLGSTKKRKHAEADKPATPKPDEPIPHNRLLAGCLAHEFLTKGTLLGQKFEPDSARARSDFLAGSISAEQCKSQLYSEAEASAAEPTRPSVRKDHESYGEVASIMKTNGTHLKGIVNPTQLSRWIQM